MGTPRESTPSTERLSREQRDDPEVLDHGRCWRDADLRECRDTLGVATDLFYRPAPLVRATLQGTVVACESHLEQAATTR